MIFHRFLLKFNRKSFVNNVVAYNMNTISHLLFDVNARVCFMGMFKRISTSVNMFWGELGFVSSQENPNPQRCQARFGRDTFGRPFLVGPNLVQHIWSGPYLVQPIFGPNPYLVGAIFGPTKFGRCHIWSNQIWSVPYLVHPNLVSIYLVCTKYKLSNQHLLST